MWCGVRSFAEASTLGHALGRGGFHHLLVLADELGQVVSDGDVEPRDGAAPEVRACRRQLLELEQGIQPEEVPVRLGVGQVVPGKTNSSQVINRNYFFMKVVLLVLRFSINRVASNFSVRVVKHY